jgi:hypothetical protein
MVWSNRYLAAIAAIIGAVISVFYATGAITWSAHVALGVILAFACAAIALLVLP